MSVGLKMDADTRVTLGLLTPDLHQIHSAPSVLRPAIHTGTLVLTAAQCWTAEGTRPARSRGNYTI